MLSTELARRLRAAGLTWSPRPGDRFVVDNRDMDDEVFFISDMTIESDARPSGRVIRFNGTTEWALDSIEQHNVTWLPREDQLRDLLGTRFVRLQKESQRFTVATSDGGVEAEFAHEDAESAYAIALLAALTA